MVAAWHFGRFVFEPGERRLRADGRDVAVGARALDVLQVLVERAGRLVTKAQLLDAAWPGLVVEENNLQVQVSALRRLIGNDAIVTVPGRGYRFDWEVRAADGQGDSAAGPQAFCAPPEPLFPLIGRERDVDELAATICAHRLVTVVGPAGVGKTSLAVEVARRLPKRPGAGGVAFCDLTPLADGTLVPQSLAAAAGIESVEGDAMAALEAGIAAVDVLLVIDNAEHLLDAVSGTLARLLARAPRASALVTSQVPLGLPGECLYRLEPLAVPDTGASAGDAAGFGSVALFVAYARAADRRFTLTEGNVAPVVESCRRLDGIPLALQLAAARLPQFGAAGIAARLDQRFRLLARQGGAAPSRQRTLAAALDWSYQLLDPQQQSLLRCFGVFAGSFDQADAAAIARDRGLDTDSIADIIGQLVDRSLVVATADEPPRYRLLESVRLHALERLSAAGETSVLERAIAYQEQRADRAIEESRATAAAVDLAAALELCARLPESAERDRRELALQLRLGPAVQASSSPGASQCEAIYGRALALARRVDDGVLLFQALWGYWHFLAMAGRDRQAAQITGELGALADRLGDDGYQLEACHARFTTAQLLGDACATLEHTQTAIRLYVPERHHGLTQAFGGHDPGVCARGQGAVALWLVGRTAEALEMAAAAERLGAACDDAYSQAVGHYYAAMTYGACRETAGLSRAADALIGVSESHGMSVLLVEGRLFGARAAFERGDREDALARLQTAYDEIVGAEDFGFVPFYATLLADARLACGDRDGALAIIEEALRVAEAGQGFFVPDLHRLRGDARLVAGDIDGALRCCMLAREMARDQGACSLALRAAIGEARARAACGDRAGARSLLGGEIDGWTGDAASRELQSARELVAVLAT